MAQFEPGKQLGSRFAIAVSYEAKDCPRVRVSLFEAILELASREHQDGWIGPCLRDAYFEGIGGLAAFRFRERLPLLLGFGSGAVIAVALFDMLPEVVALGRGKNVQFLFHYERAGASAVDSIQARRNFTAIDLARTGSGVSANAFFCDPPATTSKRALTQAPSNTP